MLSRADLAPFCVAALAAVVAGAGLGAWSRLPASIGRPAASEDVQPILSEDPNLARYHAMIAEQGGPGPLISMVSDIQPVVEARPRIDPADAALDAQIARAEAEVDARARRMEAERSAWLDTQQVVWREQARAYPVPEPSASPAEAEQPTSAEAPPG